MGGRENGDVQYEDNVQTKEPINTEYGRVGKEADEKTDAVRRCDDRNNQDVTTQICRNVY